MNSLPAGLEPAASSLEGWRSSIELREQLSFSFSLQYPSCFVLKRKEWLPKNNAKKKKRGAVLLGVREKKWENIQACARSGIREIVVVTRKEGITECVCLFVQEKKKKKN